MKIELFSREFCEEDKCFGLLLEGEHYLDAPALRLEFDQSDSIHLVCPKPETLAMLTGMIVLQAWTRGVGDDQMPLRERQPVLVITDTPGGFGEAYLRLRLPIVEIEPLSRMRRVKLWEKTRHAGTDVASYWENLVGEGDSRNRFHNFFPAYSVLQADAKPKPIAAREFLGRTDDAGPAVLILRRSDGEALARVIEKHRPFFIFQHTRQPAPSSGWHVPNVVCHDSIFAPELSELDPVRDVYACMADTAFEAFCKSCQFVITRPELPSEVARLLADVDGAIASLLEELDKRPHRVMRDVARTSLRVRILLWSLPVGVETYEVGLALAQLPASLRFRSSLTRLIEALQARVPEMAALGDWEQLIVQVLLEDFRKLTGLLAHDTPKRGMLRAVLSRQSEGNSSSAAVFIVENKTFGNALRQALAFPEPSGLGELAKHSLTVEAFEISRLEAGREFVIFGAFEPHEIFPALSRLRPRRVTAILYPGELRSLSLRLKVVRTLFPTHPAINLLMPLIENVDSACVESGAFGRLQRAGSDLQGLLRVLSQDRGIEGVGSILAGEEERGDDGGKVQAHLVELEAEGGGKRLAVLLTADARLSYVRDNDSIFTGTLEDLSTGDRLIHIDPVLRESIRQRILSANRLGQGELELRDVADRWRMELAEGIRREEMTHAEVLSRIRQHGSNIMTAASIGHWVRGTVHGPLDVNDILRIGHAVRSEWLIKHWREVGLALIAIRSGSVSIGHQITRLIQRAAVGDLELSEDERQFLAQTGITMGELQDAATLVSVTAVSDETTEVPSEKIGDVFLLDAA
jgi:hypothetical protein